MSEQRQRVEAEARERFPDLVAGDDRANWSWKLRRDAFIAGRTVTDEQVEAAAKAVCRAHQDMDGDYPWDIQFEDGKEEYRDWARATLNAVGLLIEGGE